MLAAKSKPYLLITTIAVLTTILVAACGGGNPQDIDIPIRVEHEKLIPETITVKQNDIITLRVETDDPGKLHIHGYNIQMNVLPEEVTDLSFEAAITGKFKITFHRISEHGGKEHGEEHDEGHANGEDEVDIGILEVRPR